MALAIKRQLNYRRRLTVMSMGVIGLAALIAAPLSYALIARSPSRSMAGPVTRSVKSNTVVSQATSGKSASSKVTVATPPAVRSTECTSSTKLHPALASATSSQLKKLAQYEQVCGSSIVSQLSFFVPTPTTSQEAYSYARDVAARLREFSAYGISPLVFLEPTGTSGLMNMAEYRSGKYDAVLDTYFAAIKSAQITDAMMGTWVLFPEGNTPVWTSVDPNDFAACVTKTAAAQKKYFPASKASIMLDTLSYPSATSWSGGRATSFLPYIQSIPSGLIDSFGLQGFPWSPGANESGPSNGTPKSYLRTDLAAEAARSLHTKNIWLNTGTFSVKYANQPSSRIGVSAEQRLALLTDVITQTKGLQAQGFGVSVHLFAQDKSHVPEGTDWSYWSTGSASTGTSTYVFKTFVHDLQTTGVPLWLFDTDETS
jgi:hypothetical protein